MHQNMPSWDTEQECVCLCLLPVVALELAVVAAGPVVEGETGSVASVEE